MLRKRLARPAPGPERYALYLTLAPGGDAFSPTSIIYAAAGGALLIAGADAQGAGAVRVYSPQTGALLRQLPTRAGVEQLGLLPGTGQILAVDAPGGVSSWDATTGELLRQFAAKPSRGQTEPAFSADGRFARLFTEVWDLTSGTIVANEGTVEQIRGQLLPHPRDSPAGDLRSPDGALRVVLVEHPGGQPAARTDSAGYDLDLLPADAEPDLNWIDQPKAPSAVLAGPVSVSSYLAFSPDGALLAALSDASSFHTFLRVWRIADGAVLYDRQIGQRLWSGSLAWSPDSRSITLTDKGPYAVIIRVLP
jgi:WD40 repeat protein